ncbi:MAG: hypothetical protein ACI35R_15495 [Bacillus sp. (in: firmicutes)]
MTEKYRMVYKGYLVDLRVRKNHRCNYWYCIASTPEKKTVGICCSRNKERAKAVSIYRLFQPYEELDAVSNQ